MTNIYIFSIYEADKLSNEYCRQHFPKRYIKSCKFINKKDKLLCIGAGYLITEILKCNENIIYYSDNGKPQLKDVYFNLSHSGEYSVLVVSDTKVGIDIELKDPNHISLENAVYSIDEKCWTGINPLDKFYIIWTMKESILKNSGIGIIDNLTNLSILNIIDYGYISFKDSEYYGITFEYDKHICSVSENIPIENINIYLVSLNDMVSITSQVEFLIK